MSLIVETHLAVGGYRTARKPAIVDALRQRWSPWEVEPVEVLRVSLERVRDESLQHATGSDEAKRLFGAYVRARTAFLGWPRMRRVIVAEATVEFSSYGSGDAADLAAELTRLAWGANGGACRVEVGFWDWPEENDEDRTSELRRKFEFSARDYKPIMASKGVSTASLVQAVAF
jgi:hypothetical protein